MQGLNVIVVNTTFARSFDPTIEHKASNDIEGELATLLCVCVCACACVCVCVRERERDALLSFCQIVYN